uniref:Uncharacterized protein n=1 Tax=Anopheles atroparvus TaxID=41427 RepID=A0A182J7Y9_ANOAO
MTSASECTGQPQQRHDVGVLLLDRDVDRAAPVHVRDVVARLVLEQQVGLGRRALLRRQVERGAPVPIGRVDGGPVQQQKLARHDRAGEDGGVQRRPVRVVRVRPALVGAERQRLAHHRQVVAAGRLVQQVVGRQPVQVLARHDRVAVLLAAGRLLVRVEQQQVLVRQLVIVGEYAVADQQDVGELLRHRLAPHVLLVRVLVHRHPLAAVLAVLAVAVVRVVQIGHRQHGGALGGVPPQQLPLRRRSFLMLHFSGNLELSAPMLLNDSVDDEVLLSSGPTGSPPSPSSGTTNRRSMYFARIHASRTAISQLSVARSNRARRAPFPSYTRLMTSLPSSIITRSISGSHTSSVSERTLL